LGARSSGIGTLLKESSLPTAGAVLKQQPTKRD
jgi:hypothetical protein